MSRSIAGTRILILGASSGIGLGVAKAVVEAGCRDLIISSSNNSKLQEAARQLSAGGQGSTKITTIVCDLSNSETLEANVVSLFDKCQQEGGEEKIHHIIYAAGDPVNLTPLAERSLQLMIQSGMVRFFAPIVVAKHAPKYMHEGPRASITLTGGIVSSFPPRGWIFHSAYFAGLEGVMRSLAVELKPIRVNLVSPGPVLTTAWENVPPGLRDTLENIVIPKCMTGNMATPEEVAEAYLYLIRNTSSTGSIVQTDCGVPIAN